MTVSIIGHRCGSRTPIRVRATSAAASCSVVGLSRFSGGTEVRRGDASGFVAAGPQPVICPTVSPLSTSPPRADPTLEGAARFSLDPIVTHNRRGGATVIRWWRCPSVRSWRSRDRRSLPGDAPSVYQGAGLGDPDPRSRCGAGTRADHPAGGDSESARSAHRMPLPHPVPVVHRRRLSRRRAAAAASAPRPLRGLPPLRRPGGRNGGARRGPPRRPARLALPKDRRTHARLAADT